MAKHSELRQSKQSIEIARVGGRGAEGEKGGGREGGSGKGGNNSSGRAKSERRDLHGGNRFSFDCDSFED